MRSVGTVRWEVDDRPQSLYTRLYVLGMRLARDKQAFEGRRNTLETARRRQRSGDKPPTVMTRLLRNVRSEMIGGMRVWLVRPRKRTPVARVVYVHGGGYVHPLTKDYWRLVRALSVAPAEVVVPAYPLAPDATVDDVVPRLIEVERRAGSPTLPTVLIGDSAGGALVVVIARRILDMGGTGISRVFALCPWLDATLGGPEVQELESTDPMLAESGIRAAGRWWAGGRSPSDPLVSPLEDSLDGLPPLDVVIGDRDILRPAVDDLADKAKRSDVDLSVFEATAMFHVWMTRAIPEGRRMRRRLTRLVRGSVSR